MAPRAFWGRLLTGRVLSDSSIPGAARQRPLTTLQRTRVNIETVGDRTGTITQMECAPQSAVARGR
jgi:hypothetical protein